MTSDYSSYPGFDGVYLEDSYVLSITADRGEFSFELDAVLSSDHPQCHLPNPGEQYCYTPARLVFDDVIEVAWLTKSGTRFTDATGSTDLGNIDSLTTDGQGWYFAEGDWGRVQIRCRATPRLFIEPG